MVLYRVCLCVFLFIHFPKADKEIAWNIMSLALNNCSEAFKIKGTKTWFHQMLIASPPGINDFFIIMLYLEMCLWISVPNENWENIIISIVFIWKTKRHNELISLNIRKISSKKSIILHKKILYSRLSLDSHTIWANFLVIWLETIDLYFIIAHAYCDICWPKLSKS